MQTITSTQATRLRLARWSALVGLLAITAASASDIDDSAYADWSAHAPRIVAGMGYDGRDPDATGCSADGQVIDKTIITRSNGVRVGAVRLMYSTSCLTFWARVLTDNGNAFTATVQARDALNSRSFSTSFPATGIPMGGNSPMADAAGRVAFAKGRIQLQNVAIEALTRECGAPGTVNACPPRP